MSFICFSTISANKFFNEYVHNSVVAVWKIRNKAKVSFERNKFLIRKMCSPYEKERETNVRNKLIVGSDKLPH